MRQANWLTASGELVILNNGVEFAATYFLMLLCLLWFGGGRYLSLDYYLVRGNVSQTLHRTAREA